MIIMSELHVDPYWQAFTEWFLKIPLLGQILIIVGAIAILALIIIGVFYLIKGVAYLIYYLFKGIFSLLKIIGKGIYKIIEALFYAISGKEKPPKQKKHINTEEIPLIEEKQPTQDSSLEAEGKCFCSECGSKLSDGMISHLNSRGQVFCIHCGSGIYINASDISS